jgi:hypothetical protein
MKPEALSKLTVKALRDLARELSVPGFSKMKKDDLVEAVLARQSAHATGPGPAPAMATAVEEAGAPSSSSGPAEAPRPVGPRLSELGELPQHYGRTRITLMVQKPGYLYAYWEVREHDLAAARARVGRSDARLVMRAQNLTEGYHTDIEVHSPVGDWFFQNEWHGHRVRVDLGLRGPDGTFVLLASSNEVEMPLARPSDRTDPEWAVLESDFEAIYALSGGLAQGDSAQLQRVMREGWGPSSSSGGWRG